jgi:hypothetical protein
MFWFIRKKFVGSKLQLPKLEYHLWLDAILVYTARPFDAESRRKTDAQDSVWLLSFWKKVCRQYQCKWRTSNAIVDLPVGYVNSRIVE